MAARVKLSPPMRSSAATVWRSSSKVSPARSSPSSSSSPVSPSAWAVYRFISRWRRATCSATWSSASPSLWSSPHWKEPSHR